ncbi:MAG: hypothetical protein ABEJ74_05425 [Haloferacaceae archaeon]
MADPVYAAVLALLAVTLSFPFYVRGAGIVLDADVVTWAILVRHLRYVGVGLVLTTVPVTTWMAPRLVDQFGGLSALHAVLGLQAYALLVFALTGIVRIFQVKWQADLYRDPGPDVALDDLHENMSAWRTRLRIGVFGYLLFWCLAYLLGVARFVLRYVM